MKQLKTVGLVLFTAVAFTACKNADFKTTSSGLKYKIIDGGSKDSTKTGEVLKFHVIQKVSGAKDTVMYDSYTTMPEYLPVQQMAPEQTNYSPMEVLPKLKKGDSLITILLVDSLIKKGQVQEAQLPPFLKKGDKITFTFKVLEVFKNDSLAMQDRQKEGEAYQKREEAKQKAIVDAFEKAGGKDKQIKDMEAYLKKKNINAVKSALGTFVKIDNPGTGTQVTDGKFVTVKYSGKTVDGDKPFDANTMTAQVGSGGAIPGFEDGLKQFKEGGKGVIYIPGFLAYTQGVPPGAPFKAYEGLYFEVEISHVGDAPPQQQAPVVMPQEAPKADTAKAGGKK
ncbi:FKBP-type peptidyl-prolyl cis-trans isomerase [Niabella drilacis]|uniref:peptidylprolyl isomerase n=1 Tax=Niabella drilacis (strain DSM 25811 / CCM 8410 / CCUG 62505 / LMG 26954 / E90) TaxID=1285928 RepID=A0A1G6YE55_NIADE|nr:FKBP-type peptidyl-prolyl cis-trans isomerase [Niabella drilacis]SDD88754.1 FKBP-type peptidyl-prolyl cis-trans isomerase [Niabella drilacis]